MKKIVSFAVIAVHLALLFLLAGCQPSVTSEDKRAVLGHQYAIYQDTVYYLDFNERTIKYQSINNIQETGLPLCQDVLSADRAEHPLANLSSARILVDEDATRKNGGVPVLIIAYCNSANSFDIVTFNTKTNRMKTLKEDITYIHTLHFYDGYIIYACDEGDQGYNVYSMKKDGSEHCMLENPEQRGYRVRNIYDDLIYVTDGVGNLYAATLDLKNLTYLFENCDNTVFFSNDYVYYAEYGSRALCRRPRADLSQKEVLFEYQVRGIARSSSEYLHIKTNENGQLDYNSFYIFDAETGMDTLVFENTDPNRSVNYADFNEKYILFAVRTPKADGSGSESAYLVYDREEQKEIYIPE